LPPRLFFVLTPHASSLIVAATNFISSSLSSSFLADAAAFAMELRLLLLWHTISGFPCFGSRSIAAEVHVKGVYEHAPRRAARL